ncbi:MAG: glycosyltransferase family 4 protein [Clostridiales bacterium]|nr:glycosyltransferase family 4 protein [Clostridiales bacterium]
MNILYIDHYAGSDIHGMEFRPFYMAREWSKKGYNTTIVAADFSHLRKLNPEISKDFEETKVEGINYCWIKTNRYQGNGVARIISMVQFVSKLKRRAKYMAEKYKPDVVICSSTYPFDTYAGQKIAKLANAKLIHEVHDLWPLTPMELGGYSKNHPFIRAMAAAEKSAYKNSACIVSILPNIKEYVDTLNIDTKIVTVQNGVVSTDTSKLPPANEEIKAKVDQLHSEGYFVVGYAGGISISNAIMDLIKAAELLKDKKIAFIIIGDGIEKESMVDYKEKANLERVYFFSSIKKQEIHNTLSVMDALYIGSKKSKLYKYGMSPNKIYDYMLVGKPIINALDTVHSPLHYSKVSFQAEAENPESIAEIIEKVVKLDQDQINEIKEKSINYVIDHYTYEKLAEKFAAEFK